MSHPPRNHLRSSSVCPVCGGDVWLEIFDGCIVLFEDRMGCIKHACVSKNYTQSAKLQCLEHIAD